MLILTHHCSVLIIFVWLGKIAMKTENYSWGGREDLDHFPMSFFHDFCKSITPANKLLRPIKTMLRKIYKMEKKNIKPF